MNKLFIAAAGALFLSTGAAFAADEVACNDVADALDQAKMTEVLENEGFTNVADVHMADNGCVAAMATDSAGAEVQVMIDPESGEILEAE